MKPVQKTIAFLLVTVTLMNLIPMSALANISLTKGNTYQQNQAILDSLRLLYGDEVTAQAALQELERLGLVGDGELVTATVGVDGVQLTLLELREIVFSPDADLGRVVSVDGTPVTLGDLRLMIEIEDELKRIQDTYFSDVTLDELQQQALSSLWEQISTEGITMYGATPEPVFPSGIDHRIYAEIETSLEVGNVNQTHKAIVTLKDGNGDALTMVPDYDISISYRFVDGSGKAATNYSASSGSLTFAAGSEQTSREIPFSIIYDEERFGGQKSFLIQYYNPENVLLGGGQRAGETQVKINSTYSWPTKPAPLLFRPSEVWPYFGRITYYAHEINTSNLVGSPYFAENMVDKLLLQMSILCSDVVRWGPNIYPAVEFLNSVSETYYRAEFSPLHLFPNVQYGYSGLVDYNPGMLAPLIGSNPDAGTISIHNPAWEGNGAPFYIANLLVSFVDEAKPSVVSVSMPAGISFEHGQSVPITVVYSEPVNLGNAKLTVNGETLSALEHTSHGTKRATFMSPVKKVDGTTLIVTNVSGSIDLWGHDQTGYSLGNITASGIIKGINKADAFTEASAQAAIVNGQMQGTISLGLSDPLPEWLTSEAGANYDAGLDKYRLPSIYASFDGGVTPVHLYVNSADNPTALVGNFTAELNVSGVDEHRVVEFFLDPVIGSADNQELLFGTYAFYTVPPVVFLTHNDFYITCHDIPEERAFFAEDDIVLRLGYDVLNPNATFKGAEDFRWSSSNPAVAEITSGGLIRPTGLPGSVYFSLTALNGGVQDQEVTTDSCQFTFLAGLTPYLRIPPGVDLIPVRQGDDAQVRWVSNLIAKNAENGQSTYFLIEVFTAEYSGGTFVEGERVYHHTLEADEANPHSRHTIPGAVLQSVSAPGKHSYIVRVSSRDPINDEDLAATACITVLSRPVVVRLGQLLSYHITDQGTPVTLNWALQNFNGGEFLLTVTNNASGAVVYTSATTGSQGGDYQFTPPPVPVPGPLKDIYTVAVKARNPVDLTWSYDSCVLYVYSHAALKLWIDGAAAGSNHIMDNAPSISQMSSEEILQLNRDIHLKNIISINFGEHAWGQISDQIRWNSSDNSVATINYRQGSLYENINNFAYVSYRPATEFILSGLRDGVTQVTATHAATGQQQSVEVRVQTLKDKLYLFQFYPPAETTLTYVNGDGETRSVASNESGALALFEERGIRGDVYLQSSYSARAYRGTIYNERLVSSEKDSTMLELYPENNFRLREAATAELYFKKPDGTPYTGDIILRGGVYKNDRYCPEALLNNLSGASDQVVTLNHYGKLVVQMDTTQFWVNSNTEVLSPEDKLQFMFEVRYPHDAYFPQLLTVDGTLNAYEIVRLAASTVSLTAVSPGAELKPFVVAQTAQYAGSTQHLDVRTHTGNLGPSAQFSSLTLSTRVLWWGEDPVTEQGLRRLRFEDKYGVVVPNQVNETLTYEFSTMKVTNNRLVLDRNTVQGWLSPGESRGLNLALIDSSGNVYRKMPMSFGVTNMLDVPSATQSPNLIMQLTAFGNSSSANASQMSIGDALIGAGLSYLSSMSIDSEQFIMALSPTSDPTVFRALILLDVGNMRNDNVTGIYADPSRESDFDFAPQNPKKMMEAFNYNTSHHKTKAARTAHWSLGAYMEAEVKYNHSNKRWEMLVLYGGFNAGGGMSYAWNINKLAGPIPVTMQFAVGGTMELSFQAAVRRGPEIAVLYNQEAVNDYLTTLRLYAYIRVFGGIGFDLTVVALKIGLFGQISLDAQFAFLNQPYHSATATMGQKLTVGGVVGVQFVAKFLFWSYEYIFASQSFTLVDRAYNSWDAIHSHWRALHEGSALMGARLYSPFAPGGASMYPLAGRSVLESRDYLSLFERTWAASPEFRLMSSAATPEVSVLESNSYPFANPVLTDDGLIMVYISDGGSTDIKDTRVYWTERIGESYREGQAIDLYGEGYGDSQLKVSGNSSLAAAAWVRQTVGLKKEAGDSITYTDIALMTNSTEIMASIFDGENWNTVRLTENASPDLAPVVAVNGGRALVAWRSVYPADADDPLNFSTMDHILYRTYEDGVWSEAAVLYNGTSGSVKGLEAAMMSCGTAAVAYAVNAGNAEFAVNPDGTGVDSGMEIIFAIIDNDGSVMNNIRLTNDTFLDENPQLTTALFDDEIERFVLGWHSVHDADGVAVNDIRLCAFDGSGILYADFIDSISSVAQSSDVQIGSNFRFSRNAYHISDLAILWVEQEAEDDGLPSTTADKDILRAVKFRAVNGRIYITSVLEVVRMPDLTLIDHFDAFVTADNTIKAVILATSYDGGYEATGLTVAGHGETSDLWLAVPESKMYTATAVFQNRLDVLLAAVDYEAVARGMRIPVQFTVLNAGIDPVREITIELGGNLHEFGGLLPGGSTTLTVYYDIPADRVINPPYKITATFGHEATIGLFMLSEDDGHVVEGILHMAIPDVGISRLESLREEDGERLVQVTLYNISDVELAGSDFTVKLGFYSDAALTTEAMAAETIDDVSELALIDAGSLTRQVVFDIASYVGAGNEIPSSGVRLYVRAWIEEASTEVEVVEVYQNNNVKSILFESLVLRNAGALATISTEQINEGGITQARVTVQNNSLVETSAGNLIVRLLDGNGQTLETLQSYDSSLPNNGLLELGPEAVTTQIFQFSRQGSSVSVSYSSAVLGDDTNAKLDSLTLSGIPLRFDPEQKSYTVSVTNMTGTIVTAVAQDPNATVAIGTSGLSSTNIPLRLGTNTIRVNVTAANGESKGTYQITVNNVDPSVRPPIYIYPTVTHSAGGTVVVSGDARQITIRPDPGYRVKDVLVNGQSVGAVQSYTMPPGQHMTEVHVTFEPAPGKFTIVHNSGGRVEIAEDGQSLTIYTDPGYRIHQVFVDGESVGPIDRYIFSNPGAEHHVEVFFELIPGRITITHTSGGTAALSADGLSLVITPAKGYLVRDVLVNGQSVGPVHRHAFQPGQDYNVAVSFITVAQTLTNLRDVGNHWAREPIAFVVNRGLMVGASINRFSPDQPLTRAMLATVLARLANGRAQNTAPFSDVPAGLWYSESIAWAYESGIVGGVGEGRFAPDRPATREELAVILYNYCRHAGIELPVSSAPPFADSAKISSWARTAVTAMREAGLMAGKGGNNFDPQGALTRAELAAVLHRFINR
jgi:hypothetical protein